MIDTQLSQDMDALLGIVSLGNAARQTAKIKVRQPLAELVVQPATDADRRSIERFPDQIIEELNIKTVRLHDSAKGPLLPLEVKVNPKAAGPKFGPRVGAISAAIAKADAGTLAKLQVGQSIELTLADGPVTIDPTDVWIRPKTEKGFAGHVDHGTQLLLDARITPELAREGMAREVIRHVQSSRKEAALQPEDRIALHLQSPDAELSAAIDQHWSYIAGETLAVRRAATGEDGMFKAEVKVDGKPLAIALKKA